MNSLLAYASSDEDEETPQTVSVTENKAPTQPPAPQLQQSHEGQEPQPQLAQPAAPPRPNSPELSPYSSTRSTLRTLTMPPTPNFSIPTSPPPPPPTSESSTGLAARTKRLERFLDLKRQGVHFNARLQSSSALRNPALLGKLMALAGIGREDAYASSLSEGGGVAVRWPAECDAAVLVKGNERREKKGKRPVEFVGERGRAAKKCRSDRSRNCP